MATVAKWAVPIYLIKRGHITLVEEVKLSHVNNNKKRDTNRAGEQEEEDPEQERTVARHTTTTVLIKFYLP